MGTVTKISMARAVEMMIVVKWTTGIGKIAGVLAMHASVLLFLFLKSLRSLIPVFSPTRVVQINRLWPMVSFFFFFFCWTSTRTIAVRVSPRADEEFKLELREHPAFGGAHSA